VRRLGRHLTRLWTINDAFLRLGFRQAISYPLGFAMSQISSLIPVLIFFFISRFVDRPGQGFGQDYFTSVVIGLIGVKLLDTGLRSFGSQIDIAINRGWLEMFLVEPVRWRFLPVAMSLWPTVQALFSIGAIVVLTVALGADFNPDGLPLGLVMGALAMISGLAIGTGSAAVKVLAKSGDPLLYLYTLAAQLFSGVYFPIDDLPGYVQWISFLLPHTYVVHGLRRVLLPDGAELQGTSGGFVIWILVAFSIVAYPLAIWIWGRALEYGRKLGVLGGY
jgi:ABC-2 type transport system permease protein